MPIFGPPCTAGNERNTPTSCTFPFSICPPLLFPYPKIWLGSLGEIFWMATFPETPTYVGNGATALVTAALHLAFVWFIVCLTLDLCYCAYVGLYSVADSKGKGRRGGSPPPPTGLNIFCSKSVFVRIKRCITYICDNWRRGLHVVLKISGSATEQPTSCILRPGGHISRFRRISEWMNRVLWERVNKKNRQLNRSVDVTYSWQTC